jgi:hypothetical protein
VDNYGDPSTTLLGLGKVYRTCLAGKINAGFIENLVMILIFEFVETEKTGRPVYH